MGLGHLIDSVLVNDPSPFGLSSPPRRRSAPPPTSSHLLVSFSGGNSKSWFVIVGTAYGGRYAAVIILWVFALTFDLNFAAAYRTNSTLHKFVVCFNLWSHTYRCCLWYKIQIRHCANFLFLFSVILYEFQWGGCLLYFLFSYRSCCIGSHFNF